MNKLTKAAAIAVCAFSLIGCIERSPTEIALDNGEVTQIAVAPDGTTLWAIEHKGRVVYFSSAGTPYSYSTGTGKTRRTIETEVPNTTREEFNGRY